MKTVLITGSSRGIGRACALEFAKAGYSIILNGRSESGALAELHKEISSLGCDVLSLPGDVSDSRFVDRMAGAALMRFGHVDVLINNAGISHVGLLQDMNNDDWNRVMGVNLSSAFYTCRCLLPSMLSNHSGHIINISSVWGISGASCEVAYSASKGALNSFTRALAKETAPSGIAVNAIACGLVDTDMNGCFSPEELAKLCNDIPIGRAVYPGEIAQIAHFLAEAPLCLTGAVIDADGGWI